MHTTLVNDEDGYAVWLSLEPGNPLKQANSLIVGMGATIDAATLDAVAELSDLVTKIARGTSYRLVIESSDHAHD